MTGARGIALTALAAAAVAAGGCATIGATVTSAPLKSTPLVDRSRKPPLVNSLDIDPRDGSFLLTTNRGFFRIRKDGRGYRKLLSTVTAPEGATGVGTFLTVFPLGRGELLGSGHPDDKRSKLPQFLGVLASHDDGRTWKVIAREGIADLHVMRTEGPRIYGYDAVLGALLVSTDRGRTWAEHAAPQGQLMADFVVDPRDPGYVLASTDDTLYRSTDAGKTWRPLAPALTARLAWVLPRRIVRADKDGTVYWSSDRGMSWKRIGSVGSEVWKLKAVSASTIYAAIGDGSIRKTVDGGKTWKVVFRP